MGASYYPLEVIPPGPYCYDQHGLCPYWSANPYAEEQNYGHCALLNEGDWEDEHFSLFWDQCKECSHNWDDEDSGNGRRGCDWIYLHSWSWLQTGSFTDFSKCFHFAVNGVEQFLNVGKCYEDHIAVQM